MSFSKAGLDHQEARTPEQQELMARIETDGVCPFCAEHFATYHPKPILKETDYWFVTENMSPYDGTTKHLLFVYKPSHTNNLVEISPEAAADLFALAAEFTEKNDIAGGGLFMRFGAGGYNGSSVQHLHAQLITGVEKSEDTEGLRVKLGYKKKA